MICSACGAEWTPRKPNPVKCPRCWTHLDPVPQPAPVAKPKRKAPGVEGVATSSCTHCGGLNGMHQKGCKR